METSNSLGVFYFAVGDGDRFPFQDVPGYIAVETRREQDAKRIAKWLGLTSHEYPGLAGSITDYPLGEVSRIREDKAEEILRFLYDQQHSN